ncbi:unnamed protein product [Cuscuta europaea]|uniref:BHLH domain-containing protein n=1 Tax=Cuscuta europaea TaxID=41803 RepID=A0A9P0ZF02_CUSEU|nr:unnamed protein product [Cuscuta europaea]
MENPSSIEWAENAALFPDYPSAAAAAFLSWPPAFDEEEEEGTAIGMMRSGGGLSGPQSHREAEKRRRGRINAQLATLRTLIPMSDKMDKATLLSSVVDHVKDLKRKVTEISKVLADIPVETDQVIVDDAQDYDEQRSFFNAVNFVRVSICCDDRPELFAEMNNVLKELKLVMVHADVTCLGGRVRTIILLLCPDKDKGISINSFKQSLKLALCKVAIPSSSTTYRIRSKRQRFFLPVAHFHSINK